MLYVTTRNKLDAYTPEHTLHTSRAADGGCWVPFHHPSFTEQEIAQLKDMTVNGAMAFALNRMFDKKLTSWDIDFCIGRYPVRVCQLANKVTVAEPWHNPEWQYASMVSRLLTLLGGTCAEGWAQIAVNIAVLFGVYGELLRQGTVHPGEKMDVAVLSGSFVSPMSAWYARHWGLPIENIVCACNENNSVWNLICHGQFRADDVCIATRIPQADVVLPKELERLIFECGDLQEMEDYLGCCETGRTYFPNEGMLQELRKGLYISVVSSDRIGKTISGVYAAHGYLLGPESALIFSGLQDYRAKKGTLRTAVVLTGSSPVCDSELVAEVIGEDPSKIKELL